MAHYDIFRRHLLNLIPAYGHALWDPSPGNLYPPVAIGDVGYIREGKFSLTLYFPQTIRPIATSVFQNATNN
jgi:hypothetical protein